VFIGIYWQRYGWIAPEMEISGLEDEYLLATAKPKLIYVKRPAPDREPQLDELLNRIRADDDVSYKGFSTADELEELVADDLSQLLSESFIDDRIPTPVARPRFTLPADTTTFVGRASELDELHSLLARDDVRMVTLTGPGGIGKTRLALRAAADVAPAFDEGAAFVPLASVRDSQLVPAAIATRRRPTRQPRFGRRRVESRPGQPVAAPRRRQRRTSDGDRGPARRSACARASSEDPGNQSRSAARASGARISGAAVRTGRQRADVRGSRRGRPPRLSSRRGERGDRRCDLPAVGRHSAGDRARRGPHEAARRPRRCSSVWSDGSTSSSAALVIFPNANRRCAARSSGVHDLLEDAERRMFAVLGAFVGSFSLAAAEQVASSLGAPRHDVLELLASLVDKSLLRVEPTSGEPRFRMLEMIAEFARDQLAHTDDGDPRRSGARRVLPRPQHRARRGQSAEPEQGTWLMMLGDDDDGEAGNIRVALAWFLKHGDLQRLRRHGLGAVGTGVDQRPHRRGPRGRACGPRLGRHDVGAFTALACWSCSVCSVCGAARTKRRRRRCARAMTSRCRSVTTKRLPRQSLRRA